MVVLKYLLTLTPGIIETLPSQDLIISRRMRVIDYSTYEPRIIYKLVTNNLFIFVVLTLGVVFSLLILVKVYMYTPYRRWRY